ncbi:uncharacterized protein LOC124930734 [Impatiens glandulifera]|uniref:uncharacterized protein LOC124930734 n=1 Tax=Impatiens glandulifera TaxID=253017 RepID=UPI001FB14DE9|nr:uncharacterized protein LOC124930734 [Impatiens glandulifera]
MATKRNFLSLFLLLSLSSLLLFSFYRSYLPLSTLSHSSLPTSQTFNYPKSQQGFTVTIKLLTFDRVASLSRCLRSLARADYGTDKVNLHILIDHFRNESGNLNRDSYLDSKLNETRQILNFVDGFEWRFGEKVVHYRTANVGLQAQWLEAWWPISDDEFAFVVEDDLEVSPLYYRFLRGLISHYYYNASNFSPSIYGISLQRPRFVPGKHGNKLQLHKNVTLFLYQLVGTWGQLLFPKPWKEFRLWYDIHKAKSIKPYLDGMVTTGWYKKIGERIWTPWFIKFIHSRNYFNIYTNFQHERALSVSHRDAGVNYGKTAGPDSYLLDENTLGSKFFQFQQPLSELKWYDFCFREVYPNRIAKSLDELGSILLSVQKLDTVIFVSLFGSSGEAIINNLLCQFERVNIRNYVFIGPNSDFLYELARKGHPVIDADRFHYTQNLKTDSMIFEIISKSLEMGYNAWLVNGNLMLPISSDTFLIPIDRSYDFYIGNSFEYFLVRSSSSALKIWGENLIKKVGKENIGNLIHLVGRRLEMVGAKVGRIDEIGYYNMKIDVENVNQTGIRNETRMVSWSSERVLDFVEKRLVELGLWGLDSDSLSCKSVVCHKSS